MFNTNEGGGGVYRFANSGSAVEGVPSEAEQCIDLEEEKKPDIQDSISTRIRTEPRTDEKEYNDNLRIYISNKPVSEVERTKGRLIVSTPNLDLESTDKKEVIKSFYEHQLEIFTTGHSELHNWSEVVAKDEKAKKAFTSAMESFITNLAAVAQKHGKSINIESLSDGADFNKIYDDLTKITKQVCSVMDVHYDDDKELVSKYAIEELRTILESSYVLDPKDTSTLPLRNEMNRIITIFAQDLASTIFEGQDAAKISTLDDILNIFNYEESRSMHLDTVRSQLTFLLGLDATASWDEVESTYTTTVLGGAGDTSNTPQ